jgi:diguanylate cyclase (GGDEF)-like protein
MDGLPAAGASRAAVLVVDKDRDVHRILATALTSPTRDVLGAATAAEAERVLGATPVALVVLDLVLPDADGRTLLAKLRGDARTAALPVVILCGHASPDARTECYALGADAFVAKPFDPAEVATVVTATLERASHARADARRDPVTSLPNRAAFREAFTHATTGHRGREPRVSLALLELDQYRTLAASRGWGSADRALALASRELARALRGATVVARWTGGACVALLVGAGEEEAAALVSDALATLGAASLSDGAAFTFTAGVAEWTAGSSLEEVLADAETRLMAARARGMGGTRGAGPPGPDGRRVVVVAEEDDTIASVIKRRLEREGLAVRRFADGAAAAGAAARLDPALAIVDVAQRGGGGFDALGRLRSNLRLARIPVLLLTSMGNEAEVRRGVQLEADDYLVKPFSPADLVNRVHRLLLRRR